MSTIEVQTEELKKALFMEGTKAISEVCDTELSGYEDKDTLDNLLDEAFMQMPDDVFEDFYAKYVGGSHVC